MKNQQSWDNFYLSLCDKISELSYAEDKKVGAILVKDDNIIAYSYNGTPRGSDNDTQNNPVLHAEAHAIAKASRLGISTKDTTLYCNLSPCLDCSKLIYACGINRVVYSREYKCLDGVFFLKQHGVLINEYFNPNKLVSIDYLKHTGLLDDFK